MVHLKPAKNGNWTNAVHEITMPFRNYAMSFEFIRLVRLYLGFRTYSFDLRSFTLILRHYPKTDDLDKNDQTQNSSAKILNDQIEKLIFRKKKSI